jgi:hypothetical protein
MRSTAELLFPVTSRAADHSTTRMGQLAFRAKASNKAKGWYSVGRGDLNALDDFYHSAASMAAGLGISYCRKLDSLGPGHRHSGITD